MTTNDNDIKTAISELVGTENGRALLQEIQDRRAAYLRAQATLAADLAESAEWSEKTVPEYVASCQPEEPSNMRTIQSIVSELAAAHADTLAVDPSGLTVKRAHKVMLATKVQTTTELLMLLALFHADLDDKHGAILLAEFAAQFASIEALAV
jgi:hypothetical protein